MIECIHDNTDFCLSFKEVPNPDFLTRFRTKYETEFIKIETIKNIREGKNASDDESQAMKNK